MAGNFCLSTEQDKKFFDSFMLVLGALLGVTGGLYALSNLMAARTQGEYVRQEVRYQETIAERIQPVGQVALAGEDNAGVRAPGGLAPEPGERQQATTATAVATFEGPADVYRGVCAACHDAGVAGAPKFGDAGDWQPRVAQGMDTLVEHAVEGFTGEAGFMPPKGGNPSLSDEQVRDAVQYILDESGG